MGVNGIYGLSGSGLDIESMVKVGMMSRQSQYDKMQQTYTKNEWTKAAWVDLYGKVQTFNNSTLSQYKMSVNMNAKGAKSSNDLIAATANADAAAMTHYVTVNHAATNAYIISDSKPTRANGSTTSTNVGDMMFAAINASGNNVRYQETATSEIKTVDANDVAFKFAVGDGITGSMTNSDNSVATLKPSASTSATSFYHTINITQLADNVSLTSENLSSGTLSDTMFSGISHDADSSETTVTTLSGESKTIADGDLASENALEFTLSDGTNSATIALTYKDIITNGATMETLADKINAEGMNITAAYDADTNTFSLTNSEKGSANTISITSADENTAEFFNQLGMKNSLTGTTESYSKDTATVSSGQNAAGTFDGVAIPSFDLNTASFEGYEITANKVGKTNVSFAPKFVAVTYRQLAEGYSMNDLASDINALGINVKASYDSVNDKFNIYNKESGKDNQIDLYMPYSIDSGDMTTKFFNSWGFKKSENGELTNSVTFEAFSGTNISGKDASVKIDGANYEMSDNKITVSGVTYNFTGATEGTSGTVVVTQDTDKIIENVKSFVEDYNKLLKELTDVYNEKPNKSYKPLTDSQKDQMKDEQIEKWEEKARAGLLYHDSTLGKLIDDMRSAVSTKVAGIPGSYDSIYSLGISTTGTKGQLVLDEDKLKTALSNDPDSVYNVFAKLDSKDYNDYDKSGIAQRLGDVFVSNMKSMRGVAGTDLSTNDDSDLSVLMRDLQTKMSNFKRMMQAFEEKLYKKYDKMETTLAGMGVQLNYVTMAFS